MALLRHRPVHRRAVGCCVALLAAELSRLLGVGLQVFFLLVRNGGEVAAGEIGEQVEVSGPTLSHHLDLLRRAGLVASRKHERFVYYRVRRETDSDMVRLLTACC